MSASMVTAITSAFSDISGYIKLHQAWFCVRISSHPPEEAPRALQHQRYFTFLRLCRTTLVSTIIGAQRTIPDRLTLYNKDKFTSIF